MILSNSYVDNYIFRDKIFIILNNKYENKDVEATKEMNDFKSRCDGMPCKLALIGYPLSGRKTLAEFQMVLFIGNIP